MSNDTNNVYGDSLAEINSTGGKGLDISSQRQDELDTASLKYIREKLNEGKSITALELGGGFGSHSLKMAELGAQVFMIDNSDTALNKAQNNLDEYIKDGKIKAGSLTLLKKDFLDLMEEDLPKSINILYSQRAIHYVPFDAAKNLLKKIWSRMVKNGHVYISAAGFDTEYGKTYPDRNKPVEERFNFITKEMQKRHHIAHKICTYSEKDLALLLQEAGFHVETVESSAFGNIKAQASNK